MRSVWQILGIEPTDDTRIIKRAYAAQIKKYRPDEHPQEFQEVHDAYQRALAQLASMPSPDTQTDTDQAGAATEPSAADTQQPEDSRGNEAEEELQHKRALYEYNVERIGQLLNGPADEIQNVRAWAFLTESDYIYDGEYNFFLGVATLKLLHNYLSASPSDALQNQWDLPPPKSISPPIWQFLAAVFNWAMRGNYLQSHLEPNELRLLVKVGILDEAYLPKAEKINLPSQAQVSSPANKSNRKLGFGYGFLLLIVIINVSNMISSANRNQPSSQPKLPQTLHWVNQKGDPAFVPTPILIDQRPYFRIDVTGDFVKGEIDIEEEDYIPLSGDGIGLEFTIDKNYAVSNVTVYAESGDKWVDHLVKGVAKYWAIDAKALGPIKTSVTKRIFIPLKNKGKKIYK